MRSLRLLVPLASCLALAGASVPLSPSSGVLAPLPTLNRRDAYSPTSIKVGDGLTTGSTDWIYSKGGTLESYRMDGIYVPGLPYLEDRVEAYQGPYWDFWWVSSLYLTSNMESGVPTTWHLSHVRLPNDLPYTFDEVWGFVLGHDPSVSGFVTAGTLENDGEDTVYTWTYQSYGLVQVPPMLYQQSRQYAWYPYWNASNVKIGGWTSSYSFNDWDYNDLGDFYLSNEDYVDWIYANRYNLWNAFYGYGSGAYDDGKRAGYDDAIDDLYRGLDYDQIYHNGFVAGQRDSANIEVIDMFGMFAAVLTMPFTFMATSFDATLFEGTVYAFNVSVFLYSVFIILLLWKILSLVFRGK